MTLRMLDSIHPANMPNGADAYAGYVDGHGPTFQAVKARFGAHAHVLSIAVFPSGNAEALDIESGDATPAQAPAWTRRQHGRGVARPVLYASASVMGSVQSELHRAGLARSSYRLWSAHYNGHAHICGPDTCAYPGVPACDGTQWRDSAPGNNGTLIDESLLAGNFFGSGPKPRQETPQEEPMLLLKGEGAKTPIALAEGVTKVRFFSNMPAKVTVDVRDGKGSHTLSLGYGSAHTVDIPHGIHAIVVHREDAGENDVSCVAYHP